jgi:Bacteriophage HK97-gp10, putative tail-component
VTFILNPAGLAEVLESPAGPVALDLLRRSIRVETQAKLNASGRPGPNVRTGRLRSSITHRLGVDERGLYAEVGTNVGYGFWVEMGSDRAPAYPYLRPALSAAG